MRDTHLTGVERFFDSNDIIVSKTDVSGKMTYVNDVFIQISGYVEPELIGKPHSMIRNPDMPKCVFWLLWDYLKRGEEIFAYVNNRCKNGDNYWVFAHATPNFDERGQIVGFHSNRRVPERRAIDAVKPLYAQLLSIEQTAANSRDGMEQSKSALMQTLKQIGKPYDEFVLSL